MRLGFLTPGLAALALWAAAVHAASMRVDLVDVDAASNKVPASSASSLVASGRDVQLVLPYRTEGTWLKLTLESLPPEARLVVNGVAVGELTLVLPDGRRIERAKYRPSWDPVASPVAAVFELPANVEAGSVAWLHASDRHRSLIDAHLLSAAEWRERERIAIAFALAVYGALAAFAIIAITYWTILRERMFADHALYLVSLLFFMAMSSGLFYVPFHDGIWSGLGIQAQWGFATAAIAFALGFAIRFIDVARTFPRLARVLEALRTALLIVAAAVSVSPVPTPYFSVILALVLLAINATMVGFGFLEAWRRNRYAGYFLMGWIPLTFCTTVRAFQGTGILEIPYEISYFYALGAVWEALILTAGIADRALSFRRERDLAQYQAEHDGLTGVLNRRAAQAGLDEALARSRMSGKPLAFFFLDLDHFKSINDRFGHAAGDAVLVAVAKRIAAQLRSDDLLGRWGGEEFVATLPGASVDVARTMGERIRRAVESQPVHVEGQLIPVTVSVGVAMLAGRAEESSELVRRADAALYRAKSNGRNRVEEAELSAA
jgi:diguanylate cyclase (GGDEF)-like protein